MSEETHVIEIDEKKYVMEIGELDIDHERFPYSEGLGVQHIFLVTKESEAAAAAEQTVRLCIHVCLRTKVGGHEAFGDRLKAEIFDAGTCYCNPKEEVVVGGGSGTYSRFPPPGIREEFARMIAIRLRNQEFPVRGFTAYADKD